MTRKAPNKKMRKRNLGTRARKKEKLVGKGEKQGEEVQKNAVNSP